MRALTRWLLVLLAAPVLGGCSLLGVVIEPGPPPDPDRFPDVLAVELRPAGDRVYDVAVTVASPYDTPQRYADGWRVLDAEGNVLGSHTLLHDHANEQPFTRLQQGLHIPPGITMVTVEGRDSVHGFGGATVTVDVPA